MSLAIKSAIAWLLVLAAVVGCSKNEPVVRGQLMLSLTTDLAPPQDFDHVTVEVLSFGSTAFKNEYAVGAGALTLPATLGIRAGEKAGAPVTLRISAKQQGTVRFLREIVTTIPEQRIATLGVEIEWLCLDQVEANSQSEARSLCPQGETCEHGECVSAELDSEWLPDYLPSRIFGGGDGTGSGECFDTLACFAEGREVPIELEGCSVYAIPTGQASLALIRPPHTEGICGPEACLVPLSAEMMVGWDAESEMLVLPKAVCDHLVEGDVLGVAVTTACIQKTIGLPTCGPWSSVVTAPGNFEAPAPTPLTEAGRGGEGGWNGGEGGRAGNARSDGGSSTGGAAAPGGKPGSGGTAVEGGFAAIQAEGSDREGGRSGAPDGQAGAPLIGGHEASSSASGGSAPDAVGGDPLSYDGGGAQGTAGNAGGTAGTSLAWDDITCNNGDPTAVRESGAITDFSELGEGEYPDGFAWGSSDVGLKGGTFQYEVEEASRLALSILGGSLVIKGSVQAGGYAGLGLYMDGVCFDASAFVGISFLLSGEASNARLEVQVQSSRNLPVTDNGECTGDWSNCVNNSAAIPVATEATLVEVPFVDLNGGEPISPLNPREINGLQWQVDCRGDTDCTVSLTIDDITFY